MKNKLNLIFDSVESTKLNKYNQKDFQNGINNFLKDPYYKLFRERGLGRAQNQDSLKLIVKKGKNLNSNISSLHSLMSKRSSSREYEIPVSLEELNQFFTSLYYKNGVTNSNTSSAGGLHTTEIYFLNINIVGLDKGVYFFDRIQMKIFQLQVLSESELVNLLNDSMFADSRDDIDIFNSSLVLLLGNQWGRSCSKYGNRGYRFSLIEIGAILQNIQLVSTALGLKSCPNGGFFDDVLNSLIGYDSHNENVELTVVIGK